MIPDGQATSALWSSDAWRADAVRWVDARLSDVGLERVGPPEQVRVRAWSTQLRVPVRGDDPVWLKACAPQTAHEGSVLEVLARRAPESVVAPIAVDHSRGWILTPHGGTVLREQVDAGDVARRWEGVLRAFAELQRRTVPMVPELLAAGVPDHRPAPLAECGADLLAGQVDGPRLVSSLRAACARLDDSPVPAALQHDDFHTGNVFVDGDARPRFFDWGDSYVGHPFSALLIGLAALPHQYDVELDRGGRERLVAAYLDPWSDLGPPDRLREDLDDALLVGRVARALGWHRALAHATDEEHEEWDPHPRHWIREFARLAAGAGSSSS